MIFNFIPQILILVGIAGVLTILIRRSHNLTDEELKFFENHAGIKQRFSKFWTYNVVERFPKEELEHRLILFAEKNLKRCRILISRLDLLLSKLQTKLGRLKRMQALDPFYWRKIRQKEGLLDSLKESEVRALDPFIEEKRLQKNASKTASDFVNLARLYMRDKHYSDARRALLLAWRLNPDDKTVLSLLRDIRMQETTDKAEIPTKTPE